MRITYKEAKRRFVYNWKAGRTQAKRVMIKREQIWPGGEDRIRRVALDMSELEASIDRAFWEHALDATAAVASERCHLGFTIAGRPYRVNTTYKGIARAMYSFGTLDFGENGPALSDLRVGDELELVAVIPERTSLEYEGEGAVVPLPFISDTQLRVRFNKNKKRRWAGRRFTVTGRPGGVVHFGGSCETSEHKRGAKTRVLPGNTHKWYNPVYNDEMVPGEQELVIDTSAMGSGGGLGVALLWTAFRKVFKVKVTAIEIL